MMHSREKPGRLARFFGEETISTAHRVLSRSSARTAGVEPAESRSESLAQETQRHTRHEPGERTYAPADPSWNARRECVRSTDDLVALNDSAIRLRRRRQNRLGRALNQTRNNSQRRRTLA